MALVEINRDPTPRQLRLFARVLLPAVCWYLAALAYRWYGAEIAAEILIGCGVASMIVGLVRPSAMRIVFLGWMWAAFPIGWVVSHLLMATIFYLVITPIGLAMRVLGRDPLARRFDRQATTYWTPRRQDVDETSYFRQF